MFFLIDYWSVVMKLLIVALVLTLTGCASGCREACVFGFGPGNSAFDKIADYHDATDLCQFKGKEPGHKLPNWCGASKGRVVTVTKSIHPGSYIVNVD